MSNRTLILSLMLVVIGLGFFSFRHIQFENDLAGLGLASEQDLSDYKKVDSTFTSYPKSTILILEKKSGWENYADYQLMDSISSFALNQEGAIEVSSLTRLDFPKKGPFTISWNRFVNLESEASFKTWLKTKNKFPDINQKFISKNGLYTLIYVNSQNGLSTESLNIITKQPLLSANKVKAYVLQDDLTEAIIESNFKQESVWLALICLSLILFTFYLFTKSFMGLVLIAFFIAFNIGATAIFMVALDISFNIQMIALPCLLVIFSFTDIMHIVYHQTLMKASVGDDNALQESIKKTLKTPILLTSITNVFSFVIYFLVSENEQLSNLAIISIIGVTIAYLSSRYLVIPLLSKTQFYIDPARIQLIQQFTGKLILKTKIRSKQALLPLLTLSGVILFLNIANFKIDTGKADVVTTNSTLIKSQEILTNHFYGSKSLDILISDQQDIWSLENLRKTEELEIFLTDLLQPLYSISPVTVIKRYHRFIANGDPRAYTIPKSISSDTKEVLERQYLDLGGGQIIAKDQSYTRITMGFRDPGLYESRIIYAKIRTYLKDHSNPNFNLKLAGLNVLVDEGIFRFTGKVLIGWLLALIFSALLITLYLRSFLKGLIFLLVNILPLLLVVLLMPYLNLKINPQSLFLLTILVGLCLDDSIYILIQGRKSGKTLSLYPIIVTSLVLAAGFSAFIFSNFNWLSPFAWIFLIGILAALFLDLFILPLFTVENSDNK